MAKSCWRSSRTGRYTWQRSKQIRQLWNLESFQSGTLLYIGQKDGAVPVDGIIAIIGEKGEDYEAQLKEAQASTPAALQSNQKKLQRQQTAEKR